MKMTVEWIPKQALYENPEISNRVIPLIQRHVGKKLGDVLNLRFQSVFITKTDDVFLCMSPLELTTQQKPFKRLRVVKNYNSKISNIQNPSELDDIQVIEKRLDEKNQMARFRERDFLRQIDSLKTQLEKEILENKQIKKENHKLEEEKRRLNEEHIKLLKLAPKITSGTQIIQKYKHQKFNPSRPVQGGKFK